MPPPHTALILVKPTHPPHNRPMAKLTTGWAARLLALGTHLTLFLLWAYLWVVVSWFLSVPLHALFLPLSFIGYCVLWAGVDWWRHKRLTCVPQLGLFVGVCAALFLLGVFVFAHAYDTSYDGQSYHLSGIISLLEGWNPLKDTEVPVSLLEGGVYVEGYPKLLWALHALITTATGVVTAGFAINMAAAAIGFCCVFYCMRTLKIAVGWAVGLAVLAVLQIHFLQQVTTFMADGVSYQLGIAALALLVAMLALRDTSWRLGVPFLALLILLMGAKVGNAFVCIAFAGVYTVHILRSGALRTWRVPVLLAGAAAIGVVALAVPYGTNITRYHSPIYPMSEPEWAGSLKYENIPANLRGASQPELLFYGVFSRAQPPEAGDVRSSANRAELKLPFTFTGDELMAVTNLQGRVAGGGVLFSGMVVLSFVLLGLMAARAEPKHKRIVVFTAGVVALILAVALANPAPNKLRYSSLVTAIPLVVIVGSLVAGYKSRIIAAMRVAIVVVAAINILFVVGALVVHRAGEFAQISRHMAELRAQPQPVPVVAKRFYSALYLLGKRGIRYEHVEHCAPHQRAELATASYMSVYYCINK